MRGRRGSRSLTAVLVAVLLVLAHPVRAETGYTAHVGITGRVENGYVVLFLNISLPAPTKTLEFNVSRLGDEIAFAWAKTSYGSALGKVYNGSLRFDVEREDSSFYVILVVDAVSKNSTHVILKTPVPLSPLGWVSKVEGSITLGTTFSAEAFYGNFSGGVVRYNLTVPPGSLDVVTSTALLSNVQLARVTYLNRTIHLSPGRATFVDTYTLRSEGGLPVSSLSLTLPAGYKLEGVSGDLFQYPERYISKYSSGNSTLVLIHLLTSLQAPGQETRVQVRYSTDFNGTLNAFTGLGVFVKHYSVRLCIQGVAQLPSSLVAGEEVLDSTRCYEIAKPGPIFRPDTYPAVRVSTSFAPTQAMPVGALAALLAVGFLAAVAGYAAITRRRGGAPAESRAELILRRESEAKARELLEKRRENLMAMLDQLREHRSRGAGVVRIIDLVQSYARRDAELQSEVSKVLSSLGPRGSEIFAKVQSVSDEIAATFRELLEAERMFRRGRIDKQEYKRRVEALESKISKLAGELGRIARAI
ncbi:MAG: hypothetical protein LM563_00645 [Thermofilum sp.]|nr:hypothetical protein [Thermofilum sp.]